MSTNKLNQNQHVIFKIGRETYAISIDHVERIVTDYKIRPVPNTNKEIKGIINIQEEIAPVIDLRVKFNIDSDKIDIIPYIVICRVQDVIVGLVVDEVSEVFEIERSVDLSTMNETLSNANIEYIQSVYRRNKSIDSSAKDEDDELIIILNSNKLLGLDDLEELKELKKQHD